MGRTYRADADRNVKRAKKDSKNKRKTRKDKKYYDGGE
jgi:hypothetical protein